MPINPGLAFLAKKEYQGKALYSATGRVRTFSRVFAHDLDECKAKLLEKGFAEPFEIDELPPEPATESQKEFALSLGIHYPCDISKRDMSFLIDKTKSHDGDPNPELLQFALNRGLADSQYIGKRELYNLIFAALEGRDKVAFFLFCVYRYCSEDRYGDLDTHPSREVFYILADELLINESFMVSMNRYDGASIRFFGTYHVKNSDGSVCEYSGGSVNTIAYQQAVQALRTKFNLNKKTYKTVKDASPIRNSSNTAFTAILPNAKNKWVAVFLCIFLGFLGAHKFYEGRIKIGLVYLLTLGVLGLGWLIDIFVLLSKPNPYYV